jgi:ATP-dependent DNA ligase
MRGGRELAVVSAAATRSDLRRDGGCARLFTRNGHDWSGRLPWIVKSALRNRHQQFVLDGEAVLLSADGVSDFNALTTC